MGTRANRVPAGTPRKAFWRHLLEQYLASRPGLAWNSLPHCLQVCCIFYLLHLLPRYIIDHDFVKSVACLFFLLSEVMGDPPPDGR